MADFNKLYDTYTASQPASREIDFSSILAPYIQQCNILITENEIILGNDSNPLNRVPKKNIFAIVVEEHEIYIVLQDSIYIVDTKTGATRLNIRNL